jgi:hydrogenase expression/formation protein HypC
MTLEPPPSDTSTYEYACSVVDGCLTCGDVAVPVTVVEEGDEDALCRDAHGTQGLVGVELVGPVAPGDRLLVHGGVAITRLEHEHEVR